MTTAISECYVCSVLGYMWLCVSSTLHGQRSEQDFKMAARVSSTSSVEMASSSEDSASEDPINIAKGRGADLKEPEKAEIARTRKVQRNQAGGKEYRKEYINK